MKVPHSLKFFEIPDHVCCPAGLFDADCELGALEEFRFQLLSAHRFSGMTSRRRLDSLQHPAIFEANGGAGVEVLEASSLDLRIHYVPTTLHHLLYFRALDYLIPELGDANLTPQNSDCQEEWERELRFERGLGHSIDEGVGHCRVRARDGLLHVLGMQVVLAHKLQHRVLPRMRQRPRWIGFDGDAGVLEEVR